LPIRGHGGKDFGKKSIKELVEFINKKVRETIEDF
jgi:hypothetical protein